MIPLGSSQVNKHSASSSLMDADSESRFIKVRSKEAALFIVLSYFKSLNLIKNRNSGVLIGRDNGFEVHNTVTKIAFPEKQMSPNVVGIIVSHKYGVRADKVWDLKRGKFSSIFAIEDWSELLLAGNKLELDDFTLSSNSF